MKCFKIAKERYLHNKQISEILAWEASNLEKIRLILMRNKGKIKRKNGFSKANDEDFDDLN